MLSNTFNTRVPTESTVTAPAARGGGFKCEGFSFGGLTFGHGAFILTAWPRPKVMFRVYKVRIRAIVLG